MNTNEVTIHDIAEILGINSSTVSRALNNSSRVAQKTKDKVLENPTLSYAQDLGMMLDQQGIAVRTGHHCAMPLMDALNINGTVRASFSFYNTVEEIDRLHSAIDKALSLLR